VAWGVACGVKGDEQKKIRNTNQKPKTKQPQPKADDQCQQHNTKQKNAQYTNKTHTELTQAATREDKLIDFGHSQCQCGVFFLCSFQ
jgi:hypothetical protein